MAIVHNPKNYLEKITEIWAFLSVDDGGEGIIGANIDNTFMPFVCADLSRVKSLKPMALDIAKMGNKKVKLVKFSTREEIDIIFDPDFK